LKEAGTLEAVGKLKIQRWDDIELNRYVSSERLGEYITNNFEKQPSSCPAP
jgi:hypothetical protein